MEKRPYTPPKIVRVKLEPQQAVLSACSVLATSLSTKDTALRCHPASGLNCKKHSTKGGRDNIATS